MKRLWIIGILLEALAFGSIGAGITLFVLEQTGGYRNNIIVKEWEPASSSKIELVKSDKDGKGILDEVTITLIPFSNFNEVNAYCRSEVKLSSAPGNIIFACAEYNRSEKTCTIYAKLPKYVTKDYAMEALGHEVLHCFVGDFHIDKKKEYEKTHNIIRLKPKNNEK